MRQVKGPGAGRTPDEQLLRRARRYAALGEPLRLKMVDHLALGDASPGELGAVTGLATNLLAFHLRALEEAGLIRRVRSEADKRRSYVQLCWDDPEVAVLLAVLVDGLTDAPGRVLAAAVPRVVFVCTHNSARSQLAAAAWSRASSVPAGSAGTHPAPRVHPRAVAVARRHGLRLTGARTRHLSETVQPGDLLVAVCDNAYEELAASGAVEQVAAEPGTAGPRWLHWAIPDPVRLDTDEAFEAAYAEIDQRIGRLAGAVHTTG